MRWAIVGAGALMAAAASSLYLEAQARAPAVEPFRLVVQQRDPPVSLFVHQPTGTCFVAWAPGGLVVVDRKLCAESRPPILPPVGPPISPER